ncbi:MAG: GntR family transcriptional regulator [Pseudolabrys sp.]|nr:GntR family transcriptional regulator [Pseudolabrys sp.]
MQTPGEKAYQRIRSDILFGRLAPGQRLKLDGLKDAYGVGLSTLRELLNRLTSERLIVAEGARGFDVAPVSQKNFKEIANLRQLLECHAMEQSFALGDMEWEGRVVSTHHKLSAMEARVMKGDRSAVPLWKRYDWEFHHALLSACGSKVLLETHSAVYDKFQRYLIIAVVFRGDLASIEHRQLLDCALNRDTKGGQAVLTKHIQECVTYTLAKGKLGAMSDVPKVEAPRKKAALA